MTQALIIHGGAGMIPDTLRPSHAEGIALALEAGIAVLKSGGSALDAVTAAVVVLEDLPAFNAGYGSVLNSNGYVECDAGIMDGAGLEIGAVAAVTGIRNPIRAARVVLSMPQILFAKADAEQLAEAAGVELCAPEVLITPRRLEQWQAGDIDIGVDSGLSSGPADTVGAVALDAAGRLAVATSTGGMSGKPVGRIGDSPLPGGGFYADNAAGACSTTGWGESIARVLLARRAVEGLEQGLTPAEAAQRAIDALGQKIPGGEGGLILLAPDGRIGVAYNSERMTHAWWSAIDDLREIRA